METQGGPGFGNFWDFNVHCNGSDPGGLDSVGSNNTVNVISFQGAFSATSLGVFAGGVDAIEATWIQPCGGGPFDPSQTIHYSPFTMLSPSITAGYRMSEYLGLGGTYSGPPDFFTEASGLCSQTLGTCAELMFQIPQTIINLSPPTATNDIPADHTVTATVLTEGVPEPDVLVTFEVTSGPNAGEISDPDSGECTPNDDCTTDANGEVSWTYSSSRPGTDIIVASLEDQAGSVIESDPVEKIWEGLIIPTLSQWGLIAMAGILGIVGFMVLRRRKVNA